MEKHTQTIINVCLAIFVATTIYNIDRLHERINQLEDYKNGLIDEQGVPLSVQKAVEEYCKNNADNENCLNREK